MRCASSRPPARHQSQGAAQELGLTPSAASRGVIALEHWHDAALFGRTPRGILLTDAGRDEETRADVRAFRRWLLDEAQRSDGNRRTA